MTRRRVLLLTLIVGVVLGGWVAVRGLLAHRALVSARAGITGLEAAALREDVPAVNRLVRDVQTDAARARSLTGDVVWRAMGRMPLVGSAFRSAAGVARVVDATASGPLAELAGLTETLRPSALRMGGDTIRLDPLVEARVPLARSARSLDELLQAVRVLPADTLAGPVDDARRDLLDELTATRARVEHARKAVQVLPAMLGADGPRRYFLAIQNNAETRATGGLLGAFGILEADRGRLRLTKTASTSDLPSTDFAVRMDPEFDRLYARFGATSYWGNGNVSPHFPNANRIWTGLHHHHKGVRLDGTIAIDPVALSYLLDAAGPARLPSGEVISGGNVVDVTERDAYARFADGAARDAYFLDVARAAYTQVTSGQGDPRQLFEAAVRAARERHLLVASNDPQTQRVLESTAVGGALPTEPGPFLGLFLNNAGGTKLDYYLRADVGYAMRAVDDRAGEATITVRLRNTAPATGLPDYVVLRPDNPPQSSAYRPLPRGQNRLIVSVYAGPGATWVSGSVDGTAFVREESLPGAPVVLGDTGGQLEVDSERGHTVLSTTVEIDPGAEVVLTLVVREPDRRPTLQVLTQATVRPVEVRVTGDVTAREPAPLGAARR